MPKLDPIKDRFEPCRDAKMRWLGTRKSPMHCGGVELPGLFQTSNAMRDALLVAVVVALEVFGLYILRTVGDVSLMAAAGLFAVDVVAAWMLHCGAALRCEIANRVVVAPVQDDQTALRARLPYWHAAVRFLGLAAILAMAAFKVVTFVYFVSRETPAGVVLLIGISYGVVALLHIRVTGYYLAEVFAAASFGWGRMKTLRHQPRENAPGYIKDFRVYPVPSLVGLVPACVNGHAIRQAAGRYELVTWGVLTDDDVKSLCALQQTPEQKAAVARAAIEAQLDILYSEPQGRSAELPVLPVPTAPRQPESAPKSPAPEAAAEPSPAKRNGNGAPAFSGRIMTPLLLLALLPVLLLSACVEKRKPAAGEFGMRIVVPVLPDVLPEALVEIMAPASPFGSMEAPRLAKPVLHRFDTAEPSAVPIETKVEKSWIPMIWGGEAPADESLAKLRAALAGMPADESLTGDSPDPSHAEARLLAFLGEAAASGIPVFAFEPSADSGAPSEIVLGGSTLPVFSDREALIEAIGASQRGDSPAGEVAVLYALGLVGAVPDEDTPPEPTPEPQPAPAPESEPETERLFRIASPEVGRKALVALAQAFFIDAGAPKTEIETREGGREIVATSSINGRSARIEIRDPGPGDPFAGLADGSAEVVFSPEKLPQPTAESPRENVVALDAIAACVHLSNPLEALTLPDLGRILSGEIRRWEELGKAVGGRNGPIRLHAPEDGAAACRLVERTTLAKGQTFSPGIIRYRSEREVARALAGDPDGIGFLSMNAVGGSAKPLQLAADAEALSFAPTPHTVATEDYPLSRRLYLYLAGAKTPTDDPEAADRQSFAAEFVRFAVLRREGQDAVESQGFVSQNLRSIRREAPVPAAGLTGEEGRLFGRIVDSAEQANITFRFATSSAALDGRSLQSLKRLAERLLHDPEYAGARIILVGFTDNTGTPERNLKLSIARARAVADALLPDGLVPEVVTGLGQRLPVASNTTDEGRSHNRRVEVWIKRPAREQARAGD